MAKPRISWGHELKLLRTEYNLTQAEAAPLFKLSPQALIVFERDKAGICLTEAGYEMYRARFLEALGKTPVNA